jgi:hypothetical protein
MPVIGRVWLSTREEYLYEKHPLKTGPDLSTLRLTSLFLNTEPTTRNNYSGGSCGFSHTQAELASQPL